MNPWVQSLREWGRQPLAIRPEVWQALWLASADESLDEPQRLGRLRAAVGQKPVGAAAPTVPTIGLVPIRGLLMQHSNFWTEIGLASALDRIGQQIRAFRVDPSVVAIVLDIDSPGGGVYGVEETAALIRETREEKPVVVVANAEAASAAYWIASAASELVITPSGEVGSIGVFAEHLDWSGYLEKAGIRSTVVRAGRYKAEFIDSEPLSDEARAELQRVVDEYYEMFVAAVAKGRGVSASLVRTEYGEGRMLSAKRALSAGMVDRIATIEDSLVRVAKGRKPAGSRAEDEGLDLETRRRRLQLAEREA